MRKEDYELFDCERLKSLLVYTAATGEFIWRRRLDYHGYRKGWNTRYSGRRADHIGSNGYRSVVIEYKKYQAHILAWIYITGNLPPDQIDHINGNPTDNRFVNLRCADASLNKQNLSGKGFGTSGVLGVSWNKQDKKWRSTAKLKGRSYHIGSFRTLDEAAEASRVWRRENFPGYTGRPE